MHQELCLIFKQYMQYLAGQNCPLQALFVSRSGESFYLSFAGLRIDTYRSKAAPRTQCVSLAAPESIKGPRASLLPAENVGFAPLGAPMRPGQSWRASHAGGFPP